jgi:hypothetical protein
MNSHGGNPPVPRLDWRKRRSAALNSASRWQPIQGRRDKARHRNQRIGSSARTRTWNSSADELTADPHEASDPSSAAARLQFPFSSHGVPPRRKLLLVNKLPRTRVTFGVEGAAIFGIVVLEEPASEVARLPYVDFVLRIRKHIHKVRHPNQKVLAPRPGLEPGTLRLTAECSTIELPRNRRGNWFGGSSETKHSFYSTVKKKSSTSGRTTRWERCLNPPSSLSFPQLSFLSLPPCRL